MTTRLHLLPGASHWTTSRDLHDPLLFLPSHQYRYTTPFILDKNTPRNYWQLRLAVANLWREPEGFIAICFVGETHQDKVHHDPEGKTRIVMMSDVRSWTGRYMIYEELEKPEDYD